MRSLAIARRIIKEMLRDKRTLALMFLAPIVVIWLLSTIFSVSSTVNVKVGAVDVPTAVTNNLADTKHVSVVKYDSEASDKRNLNNQKIDSIIHKTSKGYSLTYANTDPSKTTTVKMAFKNAVTNANISSMKNQLKMTTQALAKLQPNAVQSESSASATKMTVSNHYQYGDSKTSFFDKILPILMGFFVFFFVFLISGMALLKERTRGTLDRLLATPVKRSEIVFGYMISYGLLAIVQTIVIIMVTVWLLGVEVVGNIGSIVVVNLVLALVALAFGILVSTFAGSEFQMVQFIPLIVILQVFFSGIIPLDSMANWVKAISVIIPIKYSGDATTAIMMQGSHLSALGKDIGVLLIFLVILTVLNIVGLRRYRKV